MIIYENNNYKVDIGKSMIVEDLQVYVAINKTTGVVEAEEQMLPRIIDYANQLNEKIEELETDGVVLFPEEQEVVVAH